MSEKKRKYGEEWIRKRMRWTKRELLYATRRTLIERDHYLKTLVPLLQENTHLQCRVDGINEELRRTKMELRALRKEQ